jgi:hypothetical protein
MIKYSNESETIPRLNELIVFQDKNLDHISVIISVNDDVMEIIQQDFSGKMR